MSQSIDQQAAAMERQRLAPPDEDYAELDEARERLESGEWQQDVLLTVADDLIREWIVEGLTDQQLAFIRNAAMLNPSSVSLQVIGRMVLEAVTSSARRSAEREFTSQTGEQP